MTASDTARTTGVRIPLIPREEITDPRTMALIELADRVSAPKAAWYQTIAHNPEVTAKFGEFWEFIHRSGDVPHRIKELGRLAIAQIIDCSFCSGQRSVPAIEEGLTDAEVDACALPDFDHPDPQTRAALQLARLLAAGTGDPDQVYADLRELFPLAQVVELSLFYAICVGGIRLAHTLEIE